MPCIFCGSKEDLTDEHVFPAFIGSDLVVRSGSCARCNRDFGKCEAVLRVGAKFLLNLMAIENRDGNVPRARVDVEIRGVEKEGLFGIREKDGSITISDVVTESVEPDGKKHRRGFFLSEQSAEKFIQRAQARGEKTTGLGLPKEIVYDATYTQPLDFIFSLEARKVIAKIALASIACEYGVPFAMSPCFDRLRRACDATKAEDLTLRLFSNKDFMGAFRRTAYQHSVLCYLSAGMKKGWAVVTLFGGISYIVQVAENFDERESRKFSPHLRRRRQDTDQPTGFGGREDSDRENTLQRNQI